MEYTRVTSQIWNLILKKSNVTADDLNYINILYNSDTFYMKGLNNVEKLKSVISAVEIKKHDIENDIYCAHVKKWPQLKDLCLLVNRKNPNKWIYVTEQKAEILFEYDIASFSITLPESLENCLLSDNLENIHYFIEDLSDYIESDFEDSIIIDENLELTHDIDNEEENDEKIILENEIEKPLQNEKGDEKYELIFYDNMKVLPGKNDEKKKRKLPSNETGKSLRNADDKKKKRELPLKNETEKLPAEANEKNKKLQI